MFNAHSLYIPYFITFAAINNWTEVDLERFGDSVSEVCNLTNINSMHNVSRTEKKQDITFSMF